MFHVFILSKAEFVCNVPTATSLMSCILSFSELKQCSEISQVLWIKVIAMISNLKSWNTPEQTNYNLVFAFERVYEVGTILSALPRQHPDEAESYSGLHILNGPPKLALVWQWFSIWMTVNLSGTWFLPSGKRECFPTEHLCQTVKHGDSLRLRSATNKNILSITSWTLCPLLSASLLTTTIFTSLTFIFHCCNSSSGTKLHAIKTQSVVKHSSPMYLATGHGDKFALEFSWLCTHWMQSLISKSVLIIRALLWNRIKHMSVMIPL